MFFRALLAQRESKCCAIEPFDLRSLSFASTMALATIGRVSFHLRIGQLRYWIIVEFNQAIE